jgi:hypothetical protein
MNLAFERRDNEQPRTNQEQIKKTLWRPAQSLNEDISLSAV